MDDPITSIRVHTSTASRLNGLKYKMKLHSIDDVLRDLLEGRE